MDYKYYCVYMFNSFKGPEDYGEARLSVISFRMYSSLWIHPFTIYIDHHHKFFKEKNIVKTER
jgi:hypothetical protein